MNHADRCCREDLETLDTLITAGIASSRAEAARWALTRIRKRPAFEQLRARSREIEALKSQFRGRYPTTVRALRPHAETGGAPRRPRLWWVLLLFVSV